MRYLTHNDFYTNELIARAALFHCWWATELKYTWYVINNKRMYGWELV
jgi:hypothetical protein